MLICIWTFAIQIYGDFAGYSLIARGLAKLMGLDLVQNFNAPYLARSPREFWHRWHISLSTWLRDYLYFPLGGSRGGPLRTDMNLMITMVLGGLWHGAAWNFLLWGAYHGGLLVVCRRLAPAGEARSSNLIVIVLKVTGTFLLTLFGWLLFRVTSMSNLRAILGNIATNLYWTRADLKLLTPTIACFVLIQAYDTWQEKTGDERVLLSANAYLPMFLYTFMLVCVMSVGFRSLQFLYFQF